KIVQEEEEKYIGLVVIRIPQCEKLKDRECLIAEITIEYGSNGVSYYGEPVLRYYGKNQFHCSYNYTSDPQFLIPYKKERSGSYSRYTSKFKLDCYSDQYHNGHPL